jgi:hypothetical protein
MGRSYVGSGFSWTLATTITVRLTAFAAFIFLPLRRVAGAFGGGGPRPTA